MPSTLKQCVQFGLQRIGSRLESELLLCHALGKPRTWLFAHGEDSLPDSAFARFEALLARRQEGEPLAYILGQREFYGRDFHVDPAVLIPRPETELLVDLTLGLNLPDNAKVADIGTGSGCIGLSLAAERPGWLVWLCDLSADALEVAGKNARKLGLEQGTRLAQGDLLAALPDGQRVHAIVSNPPYVAAGDHHLAQGDLRFEPSLALSSGPDGLGTLRRLVNDSRGHLAPGGWLLLEHGFDQAPAVRLLLQTAGFIRVASHRDLAGIERVTLATLPA